MNNMKPQYLIIHHTATSRDRTTFEAVKKNHIAKGWGNIGYHFFINGKGNLYGFPQARGQDQVGAHCRADGMNYKSLGIALTGNFNIEDPTKEQLDILNKLVQQLKQYWTIPKENVLGHKEVAGSQTACPGKNLMPFIIGLREESSCENCDKIKEELKVANNKLDKIKEIIL